MIPSEKNWSLEEMISKAMCHRSVGDVHAVDVNGKQRWNWYIDDARRFIDAYGYKLQHFGAVYDGKAWSVPSNHAAESSPDIEPIEVIKGFLSWSEEPDPSSKSARQQQLCKVWAKARAIAAAE